MRATHAKAVAKYDVLREQARSLAKSSLPSHLSRLELDGMGGAAIAAFRTWEDLPERKVDWDWTFATSYCRRYPKAFDLSVWNKNTLLSLTLGRPTYKGKSIRMDFIEKAPNIDIYSGQLFSISQLAYETYGRLIGQILLQKMEAFT